MVTVGQEGSREEKIDSTKDFPVLVLGPKVDLQIPINSVAFWSPLRTLSILKAEKYKHKYNGIRSNNVSC